MGFESFPQQPEPSPDEEAIDARAQKELSAVHESVQIWKLLEHNEKPPLPINAELAQMYKEKLEFLKDHITKVYSPKEKEMLYSRVDAYIEKLQTIIEKNDEESSHQQVA